MTEDIIYSNILTKPEEVTPGWYAHCLAAEGTDGSGNNTGMIIYSNQLAGYYSGSPRRWDGSIGFPMWWGDSDWAVEILAGPFATSQEAEGWIVANGGINKSCTQSGVSLRCIGPAPAPPC